MEDVTVRLHDPFGFTRRTRRVDNPAKVIRMRGHRRIRVHAAVDVVDVDYPGRRLHQRICQQSMLCIGYDHVRFYIIDDETHPGSGNRGIEWYVELACFEDPQDRGDDGYVVFQKEARRIGFPDPAQTPRHAPSGSLDD